MKFCLISPDIIANGGGLEWSVQRIASFLVAEGHDIHIIGLSSKNSRPAATEKLSTITELNSWDGGVRVFDVSPYFSEPGTDYAWHEISWGLQHLFETYEYDLIHAFNIAYTGYIATLAAHKLHKPIIASGRGSDITRNIFSANLFPAIKWTLEHADWLTFVSTSMQITADQITPCLGKSCVILNSTDLSFFDPSPSDVVASGSASDAFRIGSAGILSKKKGQDVLLKAVRMLLDRGQSVQVVWIGDKSITDGDNKSAKDLQACIDSGCIQFTGIVPHRQMLLHLKKVDMFVIPSIDEGCPNALLEAMLAERPIVATRVGAVPEIIRNRRDGILVSPYNSVELADAIDELIQDQSLRQSLAQSAYSRVTDLCTIAREKQAWLECYDQTFRRYYRSD